ncbi:hypothetical protein BKA69DRAFT_1106824 [Paraphysoderma sedebokerense]|nr:hypothetical protein BKA69DRAFT_1106824 [Paraphysoderma sedebokerense]
MSRLQKYLPVVNLCIASTALIFQTTVLYPWHIQLEKDFEIMKRDQEEKLKTYHEVKIQKLEELEKTILEKHGKK